MTDPVEIARIDTERARLKVMAAGEPLLHAARHALLSLSEPASLSPGQRGQLCSLLSAAIALAQGESSPMTVESMLVLSTGHLEHDTCTIWLDTAPFAAFTKADIGWFVFVPEDLGDDPMPPDLLVCCQLARARGCAWIMFDRDAPALDTLPVYDW